MDYLFEDPAILASTLIIQKHKGSMFRSRQRKSYRSLKHRELLRSHSSLMETDQKRKKKRLSARRLKKSYRLIYWPSKHYFSSI